jgi:hypothetical protein
MASYHFITHWKVKATCAEVSDIIGDATALSAWWPSVYLDVKELQPGGENNVGRKIDLYTKGWLPYTLRWQFTVTENRKPYGFTIVASGDFEGRGIWIFEEDKEYCNITFDWMLYAEKPLLKYFSFMMRPIFEANHKWAMNKGVESLLLELQRRRGIQNVPAPPKATWPHNRSLKS